MLWVDASCSGRDVLGWLLFMVTKYPSFVVSIEYQKRGAFLAAVYSCLAPRDYS